VRELLRPGGSTRALLLVTEGVTDPELFAAAVRRPTSEHPGPGPMEP
jgi:hypothetical protein